MTSTLFKTASRLIVPLVLLFAAYIALRGHNSPGGGFIGGLMVSVALILYRLAHGRNAIVRLLPFHPRVMVAWGLGIAYATALIPLLFGRPLLTSLVIDGFYIGLGQRVHFASALFFDVGVLLVVVGVTVGMIQRLSEEVDLQELRGGDHATPSAPETDTITAPAGGETR